MTLYEPAELVLRALPGTPMDEIVALLDRNNQELAFEPMNPTTLWRSNRTGTIGGAVAVNAGGPRRIKAGAARDHVLGFRAVSGRGEIFKSGGQVMKNVTGYDLSKLIAGSHGTLAVMTEVTLKVLPKADTERTFLLYGLDEAAALAALREASGLSYEVSCFACLPDGGWLERAPGCCLAMRVEGPAISVDQRFGDLVAHFGPRGPRRRPRRGGFAPVLGLAARCRAGGGCGRPRLEGLDHAERGRGLRRGRTQGRRAADPLVLRLGGRSGLAGAGECRRLGGADPPGAGT